MWKAAAGQQIKLDMPASEDDEWETDPDFVNDVTEQEQRWGSATVAGSGRTAGAIDMCQLRRETQEADALRKKKQLMEDPSNPSFGYGGKFGVEKDRMDQSAVGHEYVAKVEKHASQKDYTTGFGGKFGLQTDRVDKSAVSWEHKEKVEKHTSQKDYVVGFGGKFGVQSDRQDKSAVGWDHVEKVEKHESQKDYAKGFGGKFGVQLDRQDKSAVGWDHHEASQKHESQTDHKIGFGGKFGLQTDRVDKSAVSFNDEPTKVGTNYTKVKPDIAGAKPSDLRAKFEEMSVGSKVEIEKNSAPKKSVHAKAAVFANNQTSEINQNQKIEPKSLDPSKLAQFTAQNNVEETPIETTRQKLNESRTAFLTQTQQQDEKIERSIPQQLDQNKVAQFLNQDDVEIQQKSAKLEEIEEKSKQQLQMLMQEEEQIYENLQNQQIEQTTPTEDDTEYYSQDEIVDTGISAVAMYDYQAAADDEISFDPDDLITHIEKIDEGWWRGLCKGKYGLFPANYVLVNE